MTKHVVFMVHAQIECEDRIDLKDAISMIKKHFTFSCGRIGGHASKVTCVQKVIVREPS